jgi:hypothetical protein
MSQLREYPNWAEDCAARAHELSDETVVYVDESFRVQVHPFENGEALCESSSEPWRAFCKSLGFLVPNWEEESVLVRRAVASSQTPGAKDVDD